MGSLAEVVDGGSHPGNLQPGMLPGNLQPGMLPGNLHPGNLHSGNLHSEMPELGSAHDTLSEAIAMAGIIQDEHSSILNSSLPQLGGMPHLAADPPDNVILAQAVPVPVPAANSQPWTKVEDDLILHSVAERSTKWSEGAALIPGRSESAVRSRFLRLNLNIHKDKRMEANGIATPTDALTGAPTDAPANELINQPSSAPANTPANTPANAPAGDLLSSSVWPVSQVDLPALVNLDWNACMAKSASSTFFA